MSTREDLLQAATDRPEDEEMRPILADHFEDDGNFLRAALIRESELLRGDTSTPQEREALLRRLQAVYGSLLQQWVTEDLAIRITSEDIRTEVAQTLLLQPNTLLERGIADTLDVTGEWLLDHPEALPLFRSVRLRAAREHLPQLLQLPGWEHVRMLNVSGNTLGHADLVLLCGCTALSALHTLDLSDNNFGEDDEGFLAGDPLRRILTAQALQHLRVLRLRNIGYTGLPFTREVTPLMHRHVESLDLSHNDIEDRAADAIATIPPRDVPSLHTVNLWGNPLGKEIARFLWQCIPPEQRDEVSLSGNISLLAISRSPLLANARSLKAKECRLDNIHHLLNTRHLTQLEHIGLEGCVVVREDDCAQIDCRHLRLASITIEKCKMKNNYERPVPLDASLLCAILRSDTSRLRELRINGVTGGDAIAADMAHTSFPCLQKFLWWQDCGLTEKGMNDLWTGRYPALKELKLIDATFGDAGLRILVESFPVLLEGLWLDNCTITPDGVRTLFSTDFPQLRKVGLDDNPVGAEGATIIAQSELLPRLEYLSLNNCQLGTEGFATLLHTPKGKGRGKKLPRIRTLQMKHNGITEAIALIDATRWSALRELVLENNPLGNTVITILNNCLDLFPHLHTVGLHECGVNNESHGRLIRFLGHRAAQRKGSQETTGTD